MEVAGYKSQLQDFDERLAIIKRSLQYEQLCDKKQELSLQLNESNLWDDPDNATKLSQEHGRVERTVNRIKQLETNISDSQDFLQLLIEDNAADGLIDLQKDCDHITQLLEAIEFECMFDGECDSNNAYLDIQAGSGGTEAQDWADMLLRMYKMWCDRQQFAVVVIDHQVGEVAGIKSCTLHIKGDYAYGWLRTEIGVHRLVRKSPFNANNKRHTSFASVFVSPEIDDKIDIQIASSDVRIDTYRASGAGGQHVNKTDSAVRLTHLPTGTVAQSQSGRSQHQNKDEAWKLLRAKLYELELLERQKDQKTIEDAKSDIGWGNQIRSYVLDDSRIKDLRTGYETRNTQDVLDGNLNPLIMTALKQGIKNND